MEALLNMAALGLKFRMFARPDILHVQYLPLLKWRIPVEMWFLRYCRRIGIRIVYTVHDLLPHDTSQRYKSTFERVYRDVDTIICHSYDTKNRLTSEFSVPESRIWVIPHGPFFYDYRQSHSERIPDTKAAGHCVVLFQGIIFPYKGLDFLLRAWQKVQSANKMTRLVIAGKCSSAMKEKIMAQIADFQLADSVRLDFSFLALDELLDLYDRADIVVYPYKAITTSGALMTGLAIGKPIIATELPAFMEVLRHDQNALLVPYGNTTALAAAILRLINSIADRQRLGKAVREMNFGDRSWNAIAEQTYLCYRAVLDLKS
jgi:glycosyltransferase involved in cell wall biosynthesis